MASLVKTDKISKIAGGSQEFTLPGADGTANQHLKTDGSGVLGWASPPTGVALTGSTNTWIPTITAADALTGTANFTYDGNVLDVKNSGTASSINLYCESSNAHYTKIKSGPHASATSYTITLPNAPPSVSGQALTATTAGVGSWASTGKVLQVVYGSLTASFSTASTTFVDTGLTATITPSSSSNKVLVFLNTMLSSAAGGLVIVNILRGATSIISNTSGGQTDTDNAWGTGGGFNQTGNDRITDNPSMVYLDSPAASTATIYKMQLKVDSSTGYVNQWGLNTGKGGVSTLCLMEIEV